MTMEEMYVENLFQLDPILFFRLDSWCRRKKFSQNIGFYNPSLMGSDPRFGDIGVRVGTTFETRCALLASQQPLCLIYGLYDL